MASGVGGLRASLIAAGRGGHNVRRPERKTAPKPSREAVNPLGRGDMDLTFGCILSQAEYGPMAGPTAIRTLAQRAETLGFHTIWFADHIVIPRHVKPFYPYEAGGASPFDAAQPFFEPLSVQFPSWLHRAHPSRHACAHHPLPRTDIHRQDPGNAGRVVRWQANPRCRRRMD